MFAGMLIEEARGVQKEWVAVEERRADGEENRALKRLRLTQGGSADGETESAREHGPKTNGTTNGEASNSTANQASPANAAQNESSPPASQKDEGDTISALHLRSGGAAGLSAEIPECDRGPLLPDHLREALRRYKKRRGGGSVGFTGLSLEGRENTAAGMGGGGRRLFR